VGGQAIVEGSVTQDGIGLPVGYARLLDEGGGVRGRGAAGPGRRIPVFRRPGTWTVRVLAPGGVTADETVTADYGHVTALEVSV